MRNRGAFALAALLAAGLGGFAWIYARATRSGEVFPRYSSLRPDPAGTRALHDALALVPGARVSRWFRPTRPDKDEPAAILWLGVVPATLAAGDPEQLDAWEAMARSGSRVVVALHSRFEPEPPALPGPQREDKGKDKAPKSSLRERWGIDVKTMRGEAHFEAVSKEWTVAAEHEGHVCSASRKFGKGEVALVETTQEFTNQHLSNRIGTPTIRWALGDHRRIVFDEHHLGTELTGSVGTMLRRHGLVGAALMLALWFALFIWRMTASFPPRAGAAPPPDAVAGRDAGSALTSLLRKHVPESAFASAALSMLRQSAPLLGRIPASRRRQAEELLAAGGAPPAELWNRAHRILHPRNKP